jgi:glycosyltransferase involved in cell wall biosynthesis
MRVLMLVENNPFLMDIRVFQEARALAEAGCQVSVICPSGPNQRWHEMKDGIHIFQYPPPLSGNGFLNYLWEYSYSLIAMFLLSFVALLKPGFDVIHAANPPDTAVFIAAFYKLLGKRFIFDHHDLAPEVYQIRFGTHERMHRAIYHILIFLEKLSCKVADQIIATNQSFKRTEIDRDHIPEERITIVRNGPASDRLEPVDPIAEIKQKGKIILVYLGVMGFQDGVDHLLRALYNLVNKLNRNDFLCVIAGSGQAFPNLKLQAHQLGLDSYVMFTGFIESANVTRYICTADICVAPEPSNLLNDRSTIIKIMEYMALGKPIVAFDLPEHTVTADGAALYACPNDELDFARKIATLIDDPEKRREMGRIGKERVDNELAWSYQKAHLLAAYSRLGQMRQDNQHFRPKEQ